MGWIWVGIWVRGSLVEGNSMTNIKAGVRRCASQGWWVLLPELYLELC